MVQWLRLSTLIAGGSGLLPNQKSRSHLPQLKIQCSARHSQINKSFFLKLKTIRRITSISSVFKMSRFKKLIGFVFKIKINKCSILIEHF